MRLINTIRKQAGTSLLEVLVALAITGLITAAILKLYVVQHQNYLTQDDITEIQQSARASIDELTRHIRMAGNGLPHGVRPITAADTDPDTITITYRIDDCETFLSAPMPQPSSELKCATDVSCFQDDQWVYIFHPDSGGGEWFVITHVQVGSKHIQHNTMTLSRAYDADAILLSMQQVKFFIDHTSDTAHPNLMVQFPGHSPQVYAENITDLQFRYRLKNGMVVDEPILAEDIREVLIAVTGRSKNPNHEDPNSDYRFRSYISSVNVRNLQT
jgi:hypothetical protein